jgi:hypothetical protein
VLASQSKSIASNGQGFSFAIADDSVIVERHDRGLFMRMILPALFFAMSALSACDEATNASTTSNNSPASPGAHWQRVCAQEYFYQSGVNAGGSTYCTEWQNKCVDAEGNPTDGCS